MAPIYDDLSELLFAEIPVLREISDAKFDYMEEVSAYLVFDSILNPYLLAKMCDGESTEGIANVRRIFDFLERLASHDEPTENWWPKSLKSSWRDRTKNLILATTLEFLAVEGLPDEHFVRAVPFMGPATIELLKRAARTSGSLERVEQLLTTTPGRTQ